MSGSCLGGEGSNGQIQRQSIQRAEQRLASLLGKSNADQEGISNADQEGILTPRDVHWSEACWE